MKKEDFKEIYMYVLGLVIIVGFFVILHTIFKYALPTENKDIGLLVIGALVTKFIDVVSFFYGSSKGSADKTMLLNKQTDHQPPRP